MTEICISIERFLRMGCTFRVTAADGKKRGIIAQPVKVKPCSATLDHLSSGKISRVKLARFPPDARRQELIEKS